VASLSLANTPWGEGIIDALHLESDVLHQFKLPHSALHFINDGLMAVFFFLVGMEIKRELVNGELSSLKRAMLPIAAAVGGMLVPAFLYLVFNKGTVFQNGWGVPMATDIAFSLGVASLLGKKFPANLKIFLTALAIIDDLGAIIVIAFFYGGQVSTLYLLGAVAVVVILLLLNKRKREFGWVHIVLGILLWWLVFNSGLHATIGGVIFAFLVPNKAIPVLENNLHNYVNFGILPVFAFANTAIVVNGGLVSELSGTLSIGIMVGLVLGKPIGIYLSCKMLVSQKIAELPRGVTWTQLTGAGVLAGIGFTMSIFIASLAFTNPRFADIAKIAILISALISMVAGLIWFRLASFSKPASRIAPAKSR
jgi:NhaA family Na+:H+ antiporter